MGRISTHVLDIARGKPAEGIAVALNRGESLIASTTTNSDGRTDAPLLSGDELAIGEYELTFQAGPYLRSTHGEPLFLDVISIRFNVADPTGNYHVPLLLAPHGYSTYRGS